MHTQTSLLLFLSHSLIKTAIKKQQQQQQQTHRDTLDNCPRLHHYTTTLIIISTQRDRNYGN